jgi:C4-dicarboxylate-specific signal transduction histidine kinase
MQYSPANTHPPTHRLGRRTMTATHVRTGRHAARLRSRLSVLSRADLEAQVTELLDQQSAISEVLRTMASSPNDLQPVFDNIVANAARLCRSERATLRMVDKEGLLLVSLKLPPEMEAGYSPPPLRVDHNSTVGRLAARKSTVHIPNLGEHEFFRAGDPTTLSWFKGGLRTLILVPMVDDDETIGLISFGRSRIEPFTEEEIDLISDFAAQAAIALGIIRRERDLRELQMELAHANRIATMGQLSSSIAHEVTQPIAAARNNARAALLFLDRQPPDLGEAREALDCVVADADRAGDIIGGIRDHFKKAPPKMDRFDMNEAIRDAITLTRGEAVNNGVSIQMQLAEGLPFFRGDRVQIQQVMVNLIVNAIQAMSGAGDGRRELQISTEADEAECVRVGVRDTGPGVAPESLPRLFEPFYTTKAEGMGMGLAICRSLVEGHGGQLWATACEPYGALFQFTIPTEQDTTVVIRSSMSQ